LHSISYLAIAIVALVVAAVVVIAIRKRLGLNSPHPILRRSICPASARRFSPTIQRDDLVRGRSPRAARHRHRRTLRHGTAKTWGCPPGASLRRSQRRVVEILKAWLKAFLEEVGLDFLFEIAANRTVAAEDWIVSHAFQ
jgi:hypothetical protein